MDIQCPRCEGRGKVIGLFPVYAEHVPPEKRKAAIELKCDTCDGSGEVTHERIRLMEIGNESKQLRIARGVGLRTGAGQVNMSPSELSQIERGLAGIGETIVIRDYWKYSDHRNDNLQNAE